MVAGRNAYLLAPKKKNSINLTSQKITGLLFDGNVRGVVRKQLGSAVSSLSLLLLIDFCVIFPVSVLIRDATAKPTHPEKNLIDSDLQIRTFSIWRAPFSSALVRRMAPGFASDYRRGMRHLHKRFF
jgi:hypothetical protein